MSTHRALLFARGSVLLAVSAALIPSPALADLSSAQATGPDRHETDVVTDQRIVRRLAEQFQSAELSLNQAMKTAENLHGGSRTVQISFEISDPPRARRSAAVSSTMTANSIL